MYYITCKLNSKPLNSPYAEQLKIKMITLKPISFTSIMNKFLQLS